MHTLWKELPKEEVDAASLKTFKAEYFVDSEFGMEDFRNVIGI